MRKIGCRLTAVEELAPNLLKLEGVGTENAGEFVVAVGENLDRLHSEASFAMMCGGMSNSSF